jgi:HSP20 family protein
MAQQQPQTSTPRNTEKSSSTRAEQNQAIEHKPERAVPVRREGHAGVGGPFSLMRRLNEEMDRMFTDFFQPGLARWGGWPGALDWPNEVGATAFWPQIEVHQSGNKLVVQADVPGLKKEDIHVEVRDNQLSISGERRSESERTEEGYYHSERSYGSFRRSVRLPEGAKPDSASATFENGVLKIEIEAPVDESRGRRIEVREGRPH